MPSWCQLAFIVAMAASLLSVHGCSNAGKQVAVDESGPKLSRRDATGTASTPALAVDAGGAVPTQALAPTTKLQGKRGTAVKAQGIPKGYDAYEKEELRIGEWRFFYIVEQADSSSIQEANFVTQGNNPRPGIDGLTAFLRDPAVLKQRAPDANVVARQVGMFLVEGSSRQSCLFEVVSDPKAAAVEYADPEQKLHPPQVSLAASASAVRAWLRRDGYLQRMVVELKLGAKAAVSMSEQLYR